MISVKYYLDKPGKNDLSPIHLVIREKDIQIKIATGEKTDKNTWDDKNFQVSPANPNYKVINKFLGFLKDQVKSFVENPANVPLTTKKLKEYIQSLVNTRKENVETSLVHDNSAYFEGKEGVTFIDLFAGAGGFSEGFLQAEEGNRYYDFLLASDINENCELTHLARYNYQLGLDMEFLKQDITDPDFLDNLIQKVGGKTVDVVCGGPPCQSFSLAGKRKKFDKKDDLFSHYLKVIRQLRPKYFVMENVKGILTKEGGKIKDMILAEIRSIIDLTEFHQFISFVTQLKKQVKGNDFLLDCYLLRLQFETGTENEIEGLRDKYILNLENKFKVLTPKFTDYKTSKTDPNINSIRHGFNLLKRSKELAYIRKKVINEKAFCDVHNDLFSDAFDDFLTSIGSGSIIEQVSNAFHNLKPGVEYKAEVDAVIKALEIYAYSFDECVKGLRPFADQAKTLDKFDDILAQIRLYKIDEPFVALASDYGVPQNRERVLFIGCRKDQEMVHVIPPSVAGKEKVTVFEALHDLDFIDNDQEKLDYEKIDKKTKYNGSSAKYNQLVKKRSIDGTISAKGLTYAEWSQKGRLNGRFKHLKNPFYVRDFEELETPGAYKVAPLLNHKTSKQNDDVVQRLKVILEQGDYSGSREILEEMGLESDKRNYNILRADAQSPTVLTIPDDYIHFANPRALTVREMARLQSFDDSFVFQGKRSTGGNKRKLEVPQYTLVGNAVPPLMARAVAAELLKNIR
jgi:DNA (cytosine-5)-methyltransferase 1